MHRCTTPPEPAARATAFARLSHTFARPADDSPDTIRRAFALAGRVDDAANAYAGLVRDGWLLLCRIPSEHVAGYREWGAANVWRAPVELPPTLRLF